MQGQPALLYLVPCTLPVVLLLAWRRGDLPSMWKGNITEAALSRLCKDSDADSQPDVEDLGEGAGSSDVQPSERQGESNALLTREHVSNISR